MTAMLTVADVEQSAGFLGAQPRVRRCDLSWCDNPERGHTLHVGAWSVVDRSNGRWGPTLGYVFRYQDASGGRAVRAFTCLPDGLRLRPLNDLDEWWKPVVGHAIKWKAARS